MTTDARRTVPQVERVAAALGRLDGSLPAPVVVQCAREAVAAARVRAEAGEAVDFDAVVEEARGRAASVGAGMLQRVVNATGVIVHTNLGRAPLADEAVAAAAAVGTGYSNLEFRLEEGERGSRHAHAGALLARAVGAEAGVVVNNNAAAVLLVLAALARGRDVVVSRGELVEIGGGFRVPDVMAESGARLVEVGTTNRTRLADYEAALGPETALVLKVHASNYRMVGFVAAAPISELAGLAVPVVFDAGSGLLDASTPWLEGGRPGWLEDEPGVRQAVADGAALVTFSGDKLLGGPQAGVVVGRRDLVDEVARHPLARAVRADKVTLAMLQSVALAYLDGRAGELPVWRMAAIPVDVLRARAADLAGEVPGAEVADTEAVVGGGSLPGVTIPSAGVAVACSDVDAVARSLRTQGVVARIEDGRLVLDLRTVDPGDDVTVGDALRAALAP